MAFTQTEAEIQADLDAVEDANVGLTTSTDLADTTITNAKKSGFHALGASTSNAPSTDRSVLITATRGSVAAQINYGQIVLTESNELWFNVDVGGTLGTWFEVVSTAATQTLTNKTLTSPTISTSPTAAGATWVDLGIVTTIDINSGTIDGTIIGGSVTAAISGTDGTFTSMAVDNISIDGNTISSTAGTDLNITPLAGQQIVLDGTIIIDAGVVTGVTSITSTTFVGALTGNADTATTAGTVTNGTQASITSAANLVTVGALNSGSITSGFGNIDNGSSTLDTGAFNATTGTFSGDVTLSGTSVLEVQGAGSVTAPAISVGVIDYGMYQESSALHLVADGSASGPGLSVDNNDDVDIPNGAFSVPNGDIDQGAFSSAGASIGVRIGTGQIQTSATLTSTRFHHVCSNGNGVVGSITTLNSATSFNTTSDPRLKTEFNTITGALDLIVQARDEGIITEFAFKSDLDTLVWGYNAHKLIDLQPGFGGTEGQGPRDAVIGSIYEDAVTTLQAILDEDGNETGEFESVEIEPAKYVTPAGVDQSKRVPMLEAAIYELHARIEVLETQTH